ncbi:glycosyltransferase family 4 protein [Rhizobium sp. TRM95111]|uniref:glycosyltransferase family 4 protein n=1 Tax=Rhizobium alarense TaxID=2846851 RepID=UPI001F46B4BD|nr:glycosyltransferase family 4 protein [Rhizobium alarense]MCF3639497.1 glycosyltransferase family 4 protein [Rhizobium alarense]
MNLHSSASQTSLRLLQVLEPSGGGSGRHFLDLCRGLTGRGHQVHAVYSPVRAEQSFLDELMAIGLAAVHAVPMARAPGPSDFAAHAALARLARQHGPFDVIHGHSSKAGALTRLRLPGRHVPRIYTPHAFRTMDPTLSRVGHIVYGGIERFLARFLTDQIICVSADEYAHARGLSMPRNRLSIVVNGVTPPPTGSRHALRERLGIPDDALVFGFVGRLSHQKAPERLVRAFSLAAAKLPQAYLLMVGRGELEAMVRGEIARSAAPDRIRLTGEVPGPLAMDAIDAVVLPSRYEAMSYVMLEAAAAGKPLILTEVGGAATVLKDGRNGVLVANVDDPRQLAAGMLRVSDAARLARYTEAALAQSGDFGIARMVLETEAVYRSVLRERHYVGA